MNTLKSIRSIVAASYPELWAYTGFLFLFGTLVAVKGGGSLPSYFAVYLVWFFAGANLFGMLLNDYFDRELDAHNPRKQKRRLLPHQYALGIAAALVSYGVLAVAFPNIQAAIWVAVAVAANAAYSIPPLRLKEHPPFDVFGGPASFLTAVFAGYALGGGGWPDAAAAGAGVLFFCGIDLAFKTLDIEADARGGIRTSANFFGRRTSLITSSLLMLGAGALVGTYHSWYVLAILPYLVIVVMLGKAREDAAKRALDARLPVYYCAAGLSVTVAFLLF